MKRGFALISMTLLACVAIFAQAPAPQSPAPQGQARLTVVCNVPDAQVFVSGRAVGIAKPKLTVELRPGEYIVKVSKPGYEDFETKISLRGRGTTLKVELRRQGKNQQQPQGQVEGGQPMAPAAGSAATNEEQKGAQNSSGSAPAPQPPAP
jgi:hypothetical protein